MAESLPSHIVDLSRSLIDDIELSRLPAEQLLLKAARLARLVDDHSSPQQSWGVFWHTRHEEGIRENPS
jgi:hypothetical protein